jgi:hypothetical protein
MPSSSSSDVIFKILIMRMREKGKEKQKRKEKSIALASGKRHFLKVVCVCV